MKQSNISYTYIQLNSCLDTSYMYKWIIFVVVCIIKTESAVKKHAILSSILSNFSTKKKKYIIKFKLLVCD